MSNTNGDTAISMAIETDNGWRGSVKEIVARKDTERTCSSVEESSDGDLAVGSADDSWLGGEPNLLPVEKEKQGVTDILAALSASERKQLEAFDTTMPIRHFRAEKGHTAKAIAQIKATLQWRIDFGVDVIVSCFAFEGTAEDTAAHKEMRQVLLVENSPGKIYARGYDSRGRALMYMTPARENTNNELNNMRNLVWNLEKAIQCTARKSSELMMEGEMPLEKVNLLIDYEGFRLQNAPPMSTTRYTLDILQKHYPERMHHAYLLHPPLVFRAFWALIRHFVDPVTKEKIVFCSGRDGKANLTDNVTDKHKLEVRSYGSDPAIRDFDSSEYMHLPFNVGFDE